MIPHTNLSAERAGVLGVLAYLYLLHHLPERGPVAGTVLSHYPHLLGALGLRYKGALKTVRTTYLAIRNDLAFASKHEYAIMQKL